MPTLPITDNCDGTTGDPVNGRTTTTGGATWVAGSAWEVYLNTLANAGDSNFAKFDTGVSSGIFTFTQIQDFQDVGFLINSAGTSYLRVTYFGGNYFLRDESNTDLITPVPGTISAAGDVISLSVNSGAIEYAINGTVILSYTDSAHTSNTFFGVQSTGNARIDDVSFTSFTPAVPTEHVSSISATAVEITATTGTGGTGPYTVQHQRSTAPDTGFSNLSNGSGISGATSLVLTDGSAAYLALGENGILWYKSIITDSLSATFESNVQGVVLGKRAANVCVIGDSQGEGFNGALSPWSANGFPFFVKNRFGYRDCIVHNASAGGSALASWYNSKVDSETGTAQAGGTNTITLRSGASASDDFYNTTKVTIVSGTGAGQSRFVSTYVGSTKVATVTSNWTTQPDNTSVYQFSGLTSRLITDAAAGVTAGCDIFIISALGNNDAPNTDAATYKANLVGICNYVLANGYTKVIINKAGCPVSLPNRIPIILSYSPKIDELANGTTIAVGDIWTFDDTMLRWSEFLQDDLLHFNDLGALNMAGLNYATGFASAMGDLPTDRSQRSFFLQPTAAY
jgi:hypothetical protein